MECNMAKISMISSGMASIMWQMIAIPIAIIKVTVSMDNVIVNHPMEDNIAN